MTISSTKTHDDTIGNGITTAFDFTFRALADAWVKVSVNGVVQAGVVVTRNVDQDAIPGGTVTLLVAPAQYAVVTVYRETPQTQDVVLPAYGPFPSKSVERALDRSAMQLQDLSRDALRSWADLGIYVGTVPPTLVAYETWAATKTGYWGFIATTGDAPQPGDPPPVVGEAPVNGTLVVPNTAGNTITGINPGTCTHPTGIVKWMIRSSDTNSFVAPTSGSVGWTGIASTTVWTPGSTLAHTGAFAITGTKYFRLYTCSADGYVGASASATAVITISQAKTDDFERVDLVDASHPWAALFGGGSMTISAGKAVAATNGARLWDASFSDDQYAQATLGGGTSGLMVRASKVATVAYYLALNNVGGIELHRLNGGDTTLGTWACANESVVRLEVTGQVNPVLRVFVNAVLAGTVTDFAGTQILTGYPGMLCNTSVGTVDNWSGGDVT